GGDEGSYVRPELEARKTQVTGLVIIGVLRGDLNWSRIGIGAMIALMLELCGVSALAFAVGVYVPIQYSTPIFLGGIVRHFVDRRLAQTSGPEPQTPEEKAAAEIEAIPKSETRPGVLLGARHIPGRPRAAARAAL